MTSCHLRLPLVFFVILIFSTASGFGQGSKIKSEYGPIEEGDRDRPDKRAEWMRRGREAPEGKSAAALRLRAHHQKIAIRAQREAASARAAGTITSATVGWIGLGP